jgi:bifunctional DNA-binding transcriptional regulator/antitoxin component of YhaV-PrlF toxin-antitoxin module
MEKIILKMTTNGRAQVPMKLRQMKHIKEGDILIVDLKEIIYSEGSEMNEDNTVGAPA